MNVWADMEAHFILSLYRPREIQVAWGDIYPHLPMYGQEVEHTLLTKERRRYDWEVVTHQRWMSWRPLSQLTDVAIMNDLATI